MKIFISWSGSTSQQIAQELRDFLPLILQGVEPFITSVDIEKGARWQGEIATQLEASNYGLVCLTRQNLASQWLAFEAGALSKHLDGRVSTVLFNVGHSEVEMPLGMFQGTFSNGLDGEGATAAPPSSRTSLIDCSSRRCESRTATPPRSSASRPR
jgi:hypothetical protein